MKPLPPDRWKRVRAIFEEALERAVDERDAFLSERCGDDADLRRQVESLLASHDEDDTIVGRAVSDAARSAARRAGSTLRVGTTLGPYRIVELLGEGGMGSVYLAERSDEAFRMRVAIKVVRGGLDSARALERFQEERRILAALEHPNIARVLDGGSTQDGLPYLVMEYVAGRQIDRFCDEARLDIRERVRLFLDICGAVDQAHRQLIVHRDIKPANVLVTDDGTPKLLDFGIAKLLEEDATPALTRTGLRLMTPDYASPEQIRGEPVTTATDVHGLGILLYELLAGRHPFSWGGLSARELEAAVLDTDPAPPSAAATAEGAGSGGPGSGGSASSTASPASRAPEALGGHIDGDLDNIVLKALAKEPERRYPSAAELRADLHRYLDGLPVSARPATLSYRAGKFLRRHAVAVSIAAAFVLTLATATVVSVRAYFKADRMRVEAETQRDRLEEVNRFLANTFQSASPEKRQSPDEITARDILDAGAARVQSDLADRPEIAAALQMEIGRRYFDLGVLDRAEELGRAAVEGHRATGGMRGPAGPRALTWLGQTLEAQGKHEEALAVLEEAVELASGRDGPYLPVAYEARKTLARVHAGLGSYDEATVQFRSLLDDVDRGLLGSGTDVAMRRTTVANDFANLLDGMGNYDEAERLFHEAIDGVTAVHGDRHTLLGKYWTNLAFLLNNAGRQAEAVDAARHALDIQEELLGPDHPETAQARQNLATSLAGIGEYEEAEEQADRALEAFREAYGERHTRVASVINGTGLTLLNQGEPERALPRLREALSIYEETFGREHHYVAIASHNVARALHEAGRLEEAERACRESLALFRRLFEGDHPHVAASAVLFARVLRDRDRPGEAEPVLRDAVRIARATLNPGHPIMLRADRELARCLFDLGEHDEAEELFVAVHAFHDSTAGPDDEETRAVAAELDSLRLLR